MNIVSQFPLSWVRLSDECTFECMLRSIREEPTIRVAIESSCECCCTQTRPLGRGELAKSRRGGLAGLSSCCFLHLVADDGINATFFSLFIGGVGEGGGVGVPGTLIPRSSIRQLSPLRGRSSSATSVNSMELIGNSVRSRVDRSSAYCAFYL